MYLFPTKTFRIIIIKKILTAKQLHPCAGFVDGGGVAEEEERHTGDAAQNEDHGEQHEERGRLKRAGRDGAEVGKCSLANQLPVRVTVTHAVMEQPEVTGMWCTQTVPDPVRLDEDYHVDGGEADGEDGPQDTDGSRVTHIVVMVNF